MKHPVIEVSDVYRYYGEVLAVDGVSFSVRRGETLGLIGHNGAGKSTLFKMMLGLIPVSAGEIRINGEPVRGSGFRELRRTIGYLPENVVFYDNLTGLETLQFFAALKNCDKRDCLAVLEKVGLSHAATRRVDGYSKGMRQRLGFAQALLGKPRLLFLDEPTSGLDPEGIREFYRILHELNADGVTVVITSHILSEIQERVERLAVIKSGKLQALGTVQELREAVDLPLAIHLILRETAEAVRTALQGVALVKLEIAGQNVVIECHRTDKMDVLRRLGMLAEVDDIVVREPTLEDVFLGYARES
ncbi:Cu-processing system ATP-binding protein [Novimethylophilus kurashikiensis]|uniref:Cu-processing system ATP-binding protein n=1 Tax=Novimethylophilus kurashikiensis TaxID=1825523 RepID=A0A2R5FB21_9PROT|nr:ABC transporter ATP-binding protein [Novimethylophilus kurashikiensis]GBG14748.1 Cu-processing system ATP-binding protein [Novimethylophilus kurashikiensis]